MDARHRRALHARGGAPHHRCPGRVGRDGGTRVRGREAGRDHPEHGGRAQRTDHGTLTVIGHLYLASLTGNVGTLGGGVNDNGGYLSEGDGTINTPVPTRRNPRIDGIPATKLGEYLVERKPHPIRAIHVAGSGVLTAVPEHAQDHRGGSTTST